MPNVINWLFMDSLISKGINVYKVTVIYLYKYEIGSLFCSTHPKCVLLL